MNKVSLKLSVIEISASMFFKTQVLERSHLWGEDGEGQFLKEIMYAKDGSKNVQVSSDRHGELKK